MDLRLKGKAALVMGGSQGIGRGIAESLCAEGATVALCARDAARLSSTAKAMGASHTITCDLNAPGEGSRVVQETLQRFGRLDILVTNNGGPPQGDLFRSHYRKMARGLSRNLAQRHRSHSSGAPHDA